MYPSETSESAHTPHPWERTLRRLAFDVAEARWESSTLNFGDHGFLRESEARLDSALAAVMAGLSEHEWREMGPA